jgi:hypothetical protein
MEEPQGQWPDIISRRLLTRAEEAENELVKQDDEAMDVFEGEGTHAADDAAAQSIPESDATPEIVTPDTKLPTAFAKVEKSLASLGFFTPSSRRIKDQRVKRINFTREIDGKRVEVSAEILPTIYGLPITADLDKYLALSEIITGLLQTNGKITNPIRFTSAELLRLLQKEVRSGKNYKDIVEWLDVMTATTIVSNGVVYIAGQKRFVRDRFHVFSRAVSVGKELEDGTVADANYVWLSDWQLENVNHNFLLPIDLETYRKLKNHISKALVPLLQIWLFASHKAGSFEKRYDELCEILNLQKYKAPSLITRQFKPSLDELTTHGYLKEWRIEKTSDRKAYKIILFHGPKFHRDRRKRLEQKSAAEAPIVIAQSGAVEPRLPEPGKLEVPAAPGEAAETISKSISSLVGSVAAPESDQLATGSTAEIESKLVDDLSARGVMPSAATKVLKSMSPERLDQVSDYIDYWDSVKATKDVGPGFLMDLVKNGDPLPSAFETRRKRAAREAADQKHQNLARAKQGLISEYEEYCRAELDRYIAEDFPAEHYEKLLAAERRRVSSQQNLWAKNLSPETLDQIAVSAVRHELSKHMPVLPFEDFCRRDAQRILARYGIDLTELGIGLATFDST